MRENKAQRIGIARGEMIEPLSGRSEIGY